MKKAVVVDKDYGSVTADDLLELKNAYSECGIDLELCHLTSEDEIIEKCRDAEAILGTGNPPVTARVFAALPKLKLVQRFGIGVNSINLNAATEYGKAVLYMPGFCVQELAEHATSMILAMFRNTVYYDRHIRQGEWPKARYYMPRQIANLTIGLYGFGGSARPLCQIFRNGFGCRVLAFDPYIPEAAKSKYNVKFVDFDTLLRESDVISLHAPLTEETKHVFNWEAFQKMRPEAAIVNIARGPLICEEDLVRALEKGEIRFAGLDVFETEPLHQDSLLRKRDDVILTCHSAFYGEGSKTQQLSWARELVTEALNEGIIKINHLANKKLIEKETGFRFIQEGQR